MNGYRRRGRLACDHNPGGERGRCHGEANLVVRGFDVPFLGPRCGRSWRDRAEGRNVIVLRQRR